MYLQNTKIAKNIFVEMQFVFQFYIKYHCPPLKICKKMDLGIILASWKK